MAILWYMAMGFKVWMFVDALRRGVPLFWYFILWLPFGDWFYFAVIKARDFGVRPGIAPAQPEQPRSPVPRLEREAQESPSFRNRTQLAWALLEEGQVERAQHYFELGLQTHPGDREATFGLGLSKLEQEDFAAAVATLTPLVEESFAYEDYDAALSLAEALYRDGRKDDAVELLHQVVRQSHRLEHLVTLAKFQLRADQQADARATLERAIEDFEALPDYMRRRNGAVATEARQLLRGLDSEARD